MKADFGLPLTLVIIDTVVAAAKYNKSGDENDAAVNQALMQRLAELAHAIGTAVVGIDHFGKATETGTRGSSAKEGSADVVFALLADRGVGGDITNTRLAIRKNRAGPSGQEFPFHPRVVDMGVDQSGTAVTTLVIDWGAQPETSAGAKPKTDRWAKSLRLLRQVLMNTLVEHGKDCQPHADGPVVRAVDTEFVRTQFYRSYLADGDTPQAKQAARQKAFRRAVNDAQARGLIGLCEVGPETVMWLARVGDEAPENA